MLRKLLVILVFSFFFTTIVRAQDATIFGTVFSADDDEPLPGASVSIVGTKIGAKTGSDGAYEIRNLKSGTYFIRATYVGYTPSEREISIKSGEKISVDLQLSIAGVVSEAISVVSSRAKFRETPVAFSNIVKEDLSARLGSQDLPMIMNETPGVYATQQGGGQGDARINIRGFNQRNVSVMINGVPVNDMETGWVYWSNWDGIGDVTQSVQIQRGLGAARIANPSVGGTMNIITDPAMQKSGALFKQEIGSDNFLKSTIVANTGDLGGFAASFAGVRKTGDGWVNMGWTDAWAYYLGLSWAPVENHSLEFYLIGAPQQHGQRSYKQGIYVWDVGYALDHGYSQEDIKELADRERAMDLGIRHNYHWGAFDETVDLGKDYYNGELRERRFDDKINTRQNYYHKPQMNLNWFWQINDKTSLTNVFYLSLGEGGGVSTSGEFFTDWTILQRDIQALYQRNSEWIDPEYSATEKRAGGILTNSANNHFWYGWLGTVDVEATDNVRLQLGGDVRHYLGEHWREARNLIGGDYYIHTMNIDGVYKDTTANWNLLGDGKRAWMIRQGDKVDFHNDGEVTWLGGFAQAEYKSDDEDLTAYLNLSLSDTKYKRIDYFKTKPDGSPGPWEREADDIIGYTAKLGANYNFTKSINAFANAGYYSRAPLFSNVFTYDNTIYDNIANEKVLAFELGAGYFERNFDAKVNFYLTSWQDKGWSVSSVDTTTNIWYYTNLKGLDALHQGIEIEMSYKPMRILRLKSSISIGDWKWKSDTKGYVYEENGGLIDVIDVYTEGLYVGDAAQKTIYLGATLYPFRRSYLNMSYVYYMDFYSEFDPQTRLNSEDDKQPWKVPNYGKMNLHFGYTLPFKLPVDIKLGGHVFNALDARYISDADDEAYYGRRVRYDPSIADWDLEHNAQNAEVFFGPPRYFVFEIEVKY